MQGGEIRLDGIPGGADGLADIFAKMHFDKMNSDKVPLKNRPKPFKGPAPKVTIPYGQYPHIIEGIISYATKPALLALRVTCKGVCKLVEQEYARHIEVQSDGLNLQIKSRWLGRIPSFRFKGEISLGASYIPNGARPSSEDERMRIMQIKLARRDPVENVWLRVAPQSVSWFKEFMKHVWVVDMDGANMVALLPLSRDEQVGGDPYNRVFLDPFPVKIIRMYPGGGAYAGFVPFKSPWVAHSVQLEDPRRPASDTWLHNTPPIPEGTEQLKIAVHLHPDLPPNLSVSGNVKYPSTLKRVGIEIIPLPDAKGLVHPTANSFKALNNFWPKLFANFRPGITFFVHNIHLFDPIQNQLRFPVRDFISVQFCNVWLGLEPIGGQAGLDKLWETSQPHLKFVRGQPVFIPMELEMVMRDLNPDGTMTNPDGTTTLITATTVVGAIPP